MCGAMYLPERTDKRGERLDPIVCTGRPSRFGEDGTPARHRGKHRTNLPGGARIRWTDEETQK